MRGAKPQISDAEAAHILDEARQGLLRKETTWKDLSARFGVSVYWLRLRLDPRWAIEQRNRVNRNRQSRARSASFSSRIMTAKRASPAEALARLAEVPEDNRDATARQFGDPLPGRSALDQRGSV